MARKRTKQEIEQSTINIKTEPVKAHMGALKFSNDDWGTIAFYIPRNSLQMNFADPELQFAGIYFLIGYEGATEKIYVGQAKKRNNGDSLIARIREHDEALNERYYDIWQCVIAITNKNDKWNDAIVSTLERLCYHEIPQENNLNGNEPRGDLSIDCTDKLNQIEAYLAIIGVNTFSKIEDIEKIQVQSVANDYSTVEDLQNGMARIPEIVTSQKVVKAMVDMLPSDVWNSQTKFLDPACKGGEYLKEIYDRLMQAENMIAEFPDEFARSNHILSQQIYGIALSQVSLDRTTNKLHGFGYNIKVIPNYIEILKSKYEGPDKNGKQKYIRGILNERFGKEMNFDVVIGNPPYQENNSTNGRQSKPIYDKFIETGIVMTSRLLVFITNNTFLTNDSKKELRDNMIRAGLKCLYNYPISGEVFKGIGVSACIFKIDKLNNADFQYKRFENKKEVNSYCVKLSIGDIIAESKYEISIPKKVYSNNNLGSIVLGDKVFGIASNGRIGFTGQGEFVDIQLIETERSVKILNKINGEASIDFIDREDIPKGTEYIDKYCVICPLVISKQSLNSFDNGGILIPGYICTQNWSIIGVFSDQLSAENLVKYMKTSFLKFIAYVYCSSAMTFISRVLMSHVPLQDFTSNSDIDWSKSIPEIDQQLYKKYSLEVLY